jgi:hypothetical protein
VRRPIDTRPWWGSPWVRVSAGVGAVVLLFYVVFVPTSLLYLSIGSLDCLGSRCGVATSLSVTAGGVALLAGLSTVALLFMISARPRRWFVFASLGGLILVALAFPAQIWASMTLSEGRALTSEAMQLAFAVDSVVQDAVVSTTGLSIWQGSEIWGPDIFVTPCAHDDREFFAGVRLHFGPGAGLDEITRREIHRAIGQSTVRQMLIPEAIDLSPSWSMDGSDQLLTVTSSCQPLPQGE